MVETSELLHYQSSFFQPETLIVAVSQSGRSAEAVRLLDMNGGRAAIIAVTNTPGSPLALRSSAARNSPIRRRLNITTRRGYYAFPVERSYPLRILVHHSKLPSASL